MKRTSILFTALLLPIYALSQGINFQSSQSLTEVKTVAKKERKYIFLDIYATWCGPCKMMEKSVYSTDSVGQVFNKNFISVKVQMDRTKKDDQAVKSWYPDAERIGQQYKITAYPTFLFFSPDGELVLRGSGYQSVENFLKMGIEATDSANNYTGMVKKFGNHELSNSEKRGLALKALKMEEKSTALKIAMDYKENYLDHLNQDQLITRENLDFIREFPDLVTSKDGFFKSFYSTPSVVDTMANQDGFAKLFRNYVITKEEINDKIWNGETPKNVIPEWERYKDAITQKYSKKIADEIMISAKLKWYTYFKDWPKVVEYNIAFIESEPLELHQEINRILLNNTIYDIIFKHATQPKELKKGINWIEQLLAYEPEHYSWIDTHSNLLYKLGKHEEAIKAEQKALELAQIKNDSGSVQEFNATILKMRKGQPTW